MNDSVRKEINLLRIHATDEEKSRLNIDTFNGGYTDSCIYGQMTGNCCSERAKELIKLCVDMDEVIYNFRAINDGVPKTYERNIKEGVDSIVWTSPLEHLIHDLEGSWSSEEEIESLKQIFRLIKS